MSKIEHKPQPVAWWPLAVEHLCKLTAKGAPLYAFSPYQELLVTKPLIKSDCFFTEVVKTILAQQVRTSTALALFERLDQALNHQRGIALQKAVLTLNAAQIQDLRLPPKRVASIQQVAHALTSGQLNLDGPWLDLRKQLLEISGIGPWSADLIGLFGRAEPDIDARTDYGVRVMLARLKQENPEFDEEQAMLAAQPYRSALSFWLWKILETQTTS